MVAAVMGEARWALYFSDHPGKLMQQLGPAGSKIQVKNLAKVVLLVGLPIGAGMNSATLGNVAAGAQRYCQTRFLCDKKGLPLPTALATAPDDDPYPPSETGPVSLDPMTPPDQDDHDFCAGPHPSAGRVHDPYRQ